MSLLLCHLSFDFEITTQMDNNTFKGLASTLDVSMQQLDKIRWVVLKQIYEKRIRLEHNMLGNSLNQIKQLLMSLVENM